MSKGFQRWGRILLIFLAVAGSITVLILEKPILGLDLRGGVMLMLEADITELNPSEITQTMEQILETVRFRVNATGLAETSVTSAGDKRVWVEIPCPAPPATCEEPQFFRDLIERQGFLEFKKVLQIGVDPNTESTSTRQVLRDEDGISYVVIDEPLITGAEIEDAKPEAETGLNTASGAYYIVLTFTETGAKQLEGFLKDGTLGAGDPLGIVLDGVIKSAPTIQPSLVTSAQTEGWRSLQTGTQITGGFGRDDARSLAIVLKSGNLPVPVSVIFEESIGPSLGQDSINKGLFATVLAGVLVLLFMIGYYKLAGVVANLTLILNLLMLVAVMILLEATWTLPGIAGLILTIGMGVDSNVLIFERVREELRSGKTVRAAIDFGYERALLTIIDAHVTTLITALILFTFGTGAIKGFATTLSIGIFINLFTALIGTRLAFDVIKDSEPRRMSI
jgi:preprotein translocase subunit SecD